jgi:putative component of toxin-antitoxin plasmid stabilization module
MGDKTLMDNVPPALLHDDEIARRLDQFPDSGRPGDVQWIFEGITELLPVYEKIADGSELMYREYQRKLKNIRKRVRSES